MSASPCYLRADELHTAFNFDFLACPWEAEALRRSIVATLDAHAPVGAPPTWVLSNHDVTRVVTRYGREDTSFSFGAKRMGIPTDLALGLARARAAALLAMALPGSFYLYQGDELGLPEVEDLPVDRIQDPMHFQSGGVDPGRDGCRVPLPWSGTRAAVRVQPRRLRRRAVAAAARRLGRAHRGRPARPPRLDPRALPPGAATSAARTSTDAGRRAAVAGRARRRARVPPRRRRVRRQPRVRAPIALPWAGTVLVASAGPVDGDLPAARRRVDPRPAASRTPRQPHPPRSSQQR